jgi:hypothetical protein
MSAPLAIFNICHGDHTTAGADIVRYEVHELELDHAVHPGDRGTWYVSAPVYADEREPDARVFRQPVAAFVHAAQSAGWPVRSCAWSDIGYADRWPAGTRHGHALADPVQGEGR